LTDPVGAAQALIDVANSRGGRDDKAAVIVPLNTDTPEPAAQAGNTAPTSPTTLGMLQAWSQRTGQPGRFPGRRT
jgi:hypothetical protein